MSIRFDEKQKIFYLNTPNTSYLFGLYAGRIPMHIHYGKKVDESFSMGDVYQYINLGFSPVYDGISDNDIPLEFPCYGSPDMRAPAFHARYENGSTVTKLVYQGYRIEYGKPKLKGLPSTYVEDDREADTLYVDFIDELTGLKLSKQYTVYNDRDVITSTVQIENNGANVVELLRVMSMTFDMLEGRDYEFIHLQGAWARERHIEKRPVLNGGQYIDSKRGASSHHHNPFFCLAQKNATESEGGVYGFGLVYSGSFIGGVEMNSEDQLRAYFGLNDFNFRWMLQPGDSFQAPEVIMTYSDSGFHKMSHTFHSLIQKRLCRGKFRDAERPVLINNWEATYYQFDEEKIVKIASTAKELGVELLVLDDGWFGHRDTDVGSLGDWYPDSKKLPNGIVGLAKRINDLGMQFGLWFEPEMISHDSDLYRAHPEWAIQIPGRKQSVGRNQLVLDVSRKDVCDYIIGFMSDMLNNAPISYVKWDMNRCISEPFSLLLPAEQQQEFHHRYMLGVYYVLETLTTKFPDVLFEGCAGGGGRFDLGMLHYYPQIWTSDDTDAVERMYIQYGTSMLYPVITMGAHVSAVPNHQVQRVTPLQTRGHMAMMGQFGYELDLNTLTEEEKQLVRQQIVAYKQWGPVMHQGEMHRLKSPFDTDYFAVEFVSEDQKYVIVIHSSILGKPGDRFDRIRLKGLDKTAKYRELQSGKTYGANVLEQIGLPIRNSGDFRSTMMIFEKQA